MEEVEELEELEGGRERSERKGRNTRLGIWPGNPRRKGMK